jgi:hypothetical protein
MTGPTMNRCSMCMSGAHEFCIRIGGSSSCCCKRTKEDLFPILQLPFKPRP